MVTVETQTKCMHCKEIDLRCPLPTGFSVKCAHGGTNGLILCQKKICVRGNSEIDYSVLKATTVSASKTTYGSSYGCFGAPLTSIVGQKHYGS